MECQDCSESITALVDNALRPEQRRKVEEHISACSDCQAELRMHQLTVELANQLPEPTPNPVLWSRIEAELLRETSSEETFWSQFRLLWAKKWIPAAALGATGFLAFFLWPSSSAPMEEDFANFLRERTQISIEHNTILFSDGERPERRSSLNPFIRPVSHLEQNPFQE